jgi:hypothetical protein
MSQDHQGFQQMMQPGDYEQEFYIHNGSLLTLHDNILQDRPFDNA